MGIRKCTCVDERRVMYEIVELLNDIRETNITIMLTGMKIKTLK